MYRAVCSLQSEALSLSQAKQRVAYIQPSLATDGLVSGIQENYLRQVRTVTEWQSACAYGSSNAATQRVEISNRDGFQLFLQKKEVGLGSQSLFSLQEAMRRETNWWPLVGDPMVERQPGG